MSNTIAPTWTDSGTSWISPQALTKTNFVASSALDLRSKIGARICFGMMRLDANAFTAGKEPVFRVFRTLSNNAIIGEQLVQVPMNNAAPYLKAINFGAGYAAAVTAMVLDGTGTPAYHDSIGILGDATAVGSITNAQAMNNLEFFRVSQWVAGTNTLTILPASKCAHNDNEWVSNQAVCGSLWLPGGANYLCHFDYGGESAANPSTIAVVARQTTYDYDTVT